MRHKSLVALTLALGALLPISASAQSPLDSMCGRQPLSPQLAQLCKQAQDADQRAREAVQNFRRQYAPKPRNAQEAVEMAGAADHPVRWVRGKDGHLYAIGPYAPDTYKTPRVPNGTNGSSNQPK